MPSGFVKEQISWFSGSRWENSGRIGVVNRREYQNYCFEFNALKKTISVNSKIKRFKMILKRVLCTRWLISFKN
jgi:hypothetical protein